VEYFESNLSGSMVATTLHKDNRGCSCPGGADNGSASLSTVNLASVMAGLPCGLAEARIQEVHEVRPTNSRTQHL
jgi:hypothetical protein